MWCKKKKKKKKITNTLGNYITIYLHDCVLLYMYVQSTEQYKLYEDKAKKYWQFIPCC